MKNRNKKIIVYVLVLIGVLSIVFIYNKKENLNQNRLVNKSYAIYVKENNSISYTNSKSIPKGSYVLNEEKSFCENNGEISNYDNVSGVVGFSFIGSDRCTLYFDEDSIAPTINNLTVNETILSAILSDNNNLVGYGLSTSNNIEPTSWTQINGTTYNLNITIESEGTYYLWVKDKAGNKNIISFEISIGTSFATLMTPNNTDIFDENGIRYVGEDPNNYICLDNQEEGECLDSFLLFRIIGLFDEEYSLDGTNSSDTKNMLKIIGTNNYGGSSMKYWSGSLSNSSNNWNKSSLKDELNDAYLNSLISISNSNNKLENGIAIAKWHLGGVKASNELSLSVSDLYTEERNINSVYSGNPSSIFAKVGLMYPSDYGYAVGGTDTNKVNCKAKSLYYWGDSSYSYCKNNNWIFKSANFLNNGEWFISPVASDASRAGFLNSSGTAYLCNNSVNTVQIAARPTFYLDSENLKIVGGDGSSSNPYHIG